MTETRSEDRNGPPADGGSAQSRFRLIVLGAGMLMIGALAGLFLRVGALEKNIRPAVLEAQALQLADASGRPRVQVSAGSDGEAAFLSLLDAAGVSRLNASVSDNGDAAFSLVNGAGAAQLVMTSRGDGAAALIVADQSGVERWRLDITATGEAMLIHNDLTEGVLVAPEIIAEDAL